MYVLSFYLIKISFTLKLQKKIKGKNIMSVINSPFFYPFFIYTIFNLKICLQYINQFSWIFHGKTMPRIFNNKKLKSISIFLT